MLQFVFQGESFEAFVGCYYQGEGTVGRCDGDPQNGILVVIQLCSVLGSVTDVGTICKSGISC